MDWSIGNVLRTIIVGTVGILVGVAAVWLAAAALGRTSAGRT